MSFLDEKERRWRNQQNDIINYRHYVVLFSQEIRKILGIQVPIAQHTKLPPVYVAKALANSIKNTPSLGCEYLIEESMNSNPVSTIRLFFEGNVEIIGIFRHLTKKRESVILVSSDDAVNILSTIEVVLEALRKKFIDFIKTGGNVL